MDNYLSYDGLKQEVLDLLDQNRDMVLATAANDRVTARAMTCIHQDLKIYFQTDQNFLKCQQIAANPQVALCLGNMQIEGKAKILGHTSEVSNQEIAAVYQKFHPGSFKAYGSRESQVFVEVEIVRVTFWKYENSDSLRDFLDVREHKAFREYYCKLP